MSQDTAASSVHLFPPPHVADIAASALTLVNMKTLAGMEGNLARPEDHCGGMQLNTIR